MEGGYIWCMLNLKIKLKTVFLYVELTDERIIGIEWMNGWMDELMDERRDECTDKWKNDTSDEC